MKISLKFWGLIAILLLTCAACLPAPTAAPTLPPALTPAATLLPTQAETPRPSSTQTPSPAFSSTPSQTFTSVPTLTPAPSSTGTPRPAFAGFQVEYVEYSAAYGMQFAFSIPGIRQNYGLNVNGKAYTCNYYEKYPDKLFCTGPVIAPKTQVKLSFFSLDGTQPEVFSNSFLIPAQVTPTVDPTLAKGFNPANCPVRGVNVRCETEYRVLGNGCCVVATCVDACGYYYSVDTCPVGMSMQGICQGTPPVIPPAP